MHDELRCLEPGHALLLEPAPALFHIEPPVTHHESGHSLPQPLVGTAHGHCLADEGVGLEDALDLGGGDVLAGADDHVLQPPHDGEPALVVEDAEVAGGEPAATDGPPRLGLVAVAHEQLGAAEQHLARLPRRSRPVGVGVDDPDHTLAHGTTVGVAGRARGRRRRCWS